MTNFLDSSTSPAHSLGTKDDAALDADSRKVDPRNKLNDLSSTEWVAETVSVWAQKGLGARHPDTRIERQHPAPFSFTDVGRLIRFFTKAGAVVLDPFVGIGSTLKACALHGRRGIGFELNEEYVTLTHERLLSEVGFAAIEHSQIIQCGDARILTQELPTDSIDFVVTSPPYWNILHKEDHKARQERIQRKLDTRYSDDPRDLGNIGDYASFLSDLAGVLGECGRALKPRKYMAVIVSDFRDGPRYITFHSHLAEALQDHSLELRGLTILHQRQKRIFPYGYPYAYVPNIHHQYVLILQNAKAK